MIYIYLALAVILISLVMYVLACIDKKSSYDDIPIFNVIEGNGNFYFLVRYYIWQGNKVRRAKEIYSQNTILEVDGYKYEITRCGEGFPASDGVMFFEKELRFWGEPLRTLQSIKNENVIINQYGSGNISIQLNNNEIVNKFVDIQEYISNDTNIDGVDKQVLQDFISNILNNKSIEQNQARTAYNVFLKYEPLLSFAVDVVSLLKDFFIK